MVTTSGDSSPHSSPKKITRKSETEEEYINQKRLERCINQLQCIHLFWIPIKTKELVKQLLCDPCTSFTWETLREKEKNQIIQSNVLINMATRPPDEETNDIHQGEGLYLWNVLNSPQLSIAYSK